MNPVDVLNQIKRLTTDVIAVGICDEQNFPSIKSYTGNISEIGVSSSDNSIFLKDVPYREMYSELKIDFALHGSCFDLFTFGRLCFGCTRGGNKTTDCFDVL